MTEDQLQAAIWKRAWNDYPEARRCMWAVPNGGSRNPVEAMKLKATGLLKGVWDMHLFWKGKFYVFEFKVGVNPLSPSQKDWGMLMREHGAIAYVIQTEEEFFNVFDKIIKL